MKSKRVAKFQLQMPALKKIMIFVCFLFTGSHVHSQLSALICPDYSPLPADQFEIEFCQEPSNSIDFDSEALGAGCAEPLTIPAPGQQHVLQGSADSPDGAHDIDFYAFTLENYILMRVTPTKSHQVLSSYSFQQFPEDWSDCDAFISPYESSFNNGFVLFNCSTVETILFTPGHYYFYMSHGSNQVSIGCGEVEYQIKFENLGEYVPGEICDVGTEITPAATWNISNITANLNTGSVSNDLNCAANTTPQKDLWFKFTATHENMLVSAKRNGTSNLNVAIEVYEDCGGAPIICQDAYPGNTNEVVVINNTVIGQQYYFRVYHNGVGTLSNGNIFAGVAFVPQTKLWDASCGVMNLTDASIIRSDWPANTFMLDSWQFKFTEAVPPYNTYEITSPNGTNPQFRMTWFPQRQPGMTYYVQTRPKMYQGPTWADYGDGCFIAMAPAPSGMAPNTNGGMTQADVVTDGSFNLNLWPNPTQGQVTLSFETLDADVSADVQIFDISGKQVDRVYNGLSGTAGYQNLIYDTDKLETGMYLIQVRTDSHSSVARLVVNK